MKHLTETLKRNPEIFTTKDITNGDILIQRNGYHWYYDGDKNVFMHCSEVGKPLIQKYDLFMRDLTDDLKNIPGKPGYSSPNYDIVKVYRSGGIDNPKFKSIRKVVDDTEPVWIAKDWKFDGKSAYFD